MPTPDVVKLMDSSSQQEYRELKQKLRMKQRSTEPMSFKSKPDAEKSRLVTIGSASGGVTVDQDKSRSVVDPEKSSNLTDNVKQSRSITVDSSGSVSATIQNISQDKEGMKSGPMNVEEQEQEEEEDEETKLKRKNEEQKIVRQMEMKLIEYR